MNPSSPQMPLPGLPKKSHLSLMSNLVLGILFIVTAIFAASYYSKASTSTTKLNAQIATAVAAAEKTQAAALATQYGNAAKAPYKTYTGSSTYGSISFSYPKTWSGYVDTTSSSEPINGYFYPDVVPGVSGTSAYALRVELTSTDYSDVLAQYQSQITDGTLTASAYVPPKMVGVANVVPGTLLTGIIDQTNNFTGSMVIIKVRDQTLQIYTDSTSFSSDFTGIVLASLTFVP